MRDSGRMFPLARSRASGLINEVTGSPALVGARRSAERFSARAGEIAAEQKTAADSKDYREATASFLEKRPPVFRGR